MPQNVRTTIEPVPSKKTKNDYRKQKDVHYVFRIDEHTVIDCTSGDIDLRLLVDFGSKCSLITEETWNKLKSAAIKAFDQVISPDKALRPLGCKDRPVSRHNDI